MADIFRGPTYAKHHRRPEPPPQWAAPNLLTSTLFVAAAAIPFQTASAFPAQVSHPSHRLSANADTSLGTPKTLTADSVSPFFVASHVGPQRSRTSNADTSSGGPLTLFPVVAVSAPFLPVPSIQVDGRRRGEVRSDVPPNLTLGLPPDQIASAVPETLAIYRQPVTPTNTSFRASVVLDVVVAAPPFFNAPHIASAKLRWQPADNSAGIPKTLTVDASVPFFNAPTFAPQAKSKRGQLNADTSGGLNNALASFIPSAPFAQTDWPGPIRKPPFHETSWGYGPNPNLFPPVPTFGTGAVLYLPVRFWANSTSVGVVPSTNQANLKTWLPPIGVPIADKDGTMNVQWYRFFNYFANVKAGGPEAPTVTDIAASATVAQAQATSTAQTLTAVTQVVVQNAEALSATVEVAQSNALTGATQIPNVRRYVE